MHNVFAMRLNTELSFEEKVVNPRYDLDERLRLPFGKFTTFDMAKM
jgi:hypothetical protein